MWRKGRTQAEVFKNRALLRYSTGRGAKAVRRRACCNGERLAWGLSPLVKEGRKRAWQWETNPKARRSLFIRSPPQKCGEKLNCWITVFVRRYLHSSNGYEWCIRFIYSRRTRKHNGDLRIRCPICSLCADFTATASKWRGDSPSWARRYSKDCDYLFTFYDVWDAGILVTVLTYEGVLISL